MFIIHVIKFMCVLAISITISSCVVATSTYEGVVKKSDSLQEYVSVIKRQNMILENQNRAHISLIDDLQNEIQSCKKRVYTIEQQFEQAKSANSEEIKLLLNQLESAEKDLFTREAKLREVELIVKQRDSAMNYLKSGLEKSLLGFKESGLEVEVKNGKVYVKMSNQLLFKSGSASIDKMGREALKNLADVLLVQEDISVLIEGHTDNVPINSPKFTDNWDLSVLRSTEVARILTLENGIDPKRITASGRSEFIPVQEGDSPDIRAKNRRTEIILSPKLDELFSIVKQ
ncbi:MAG: hypothetical protein RL348_1689 [Bacteroidota bacterium]